MNQNEIIEKVTGHTHEIKSLKHRVDALEKKQDDISSLALSVNKLAINMEHMLNEQKQQGERLQKLESEPLENAKHYKRLIIGSICTTLLGAIIGALISLIF